MRRLRSERVTRPRLLYNSVRTACAQPTNRAITSVRLHCQAKPFYDSIIVVRPSCRLHGRKCSLSGNPRDSLFSMHRSIRANSQARWLKSHRDVTRKSIIPSCVSIGVCATAAGSDCRSHTSTRTLDSDFPDTYFSDHLDKVFPPLRFPPELGARLLTHASHKAATRGHNLRYSFIGELASTEVYPLNSHLHGYV
jgi:hypothetical protein